MRKANLIRSILRFVDESVEIVEAAYMWRRDRRMVPFAAAAFVGMVVVAAWVGWDDWPTRVAIGLAGAALAVAASTEYRVLAQTADGTILLLRASRIRQAATRLLETLPSDAMIERVGGTVLAADWQVADSVYTVPRSSEQAIGRIAGTA